MDNVIKSILRRLASLEKRPTGSVTVTGGGGGALDDLTDVTITAPTVGDVLSYDGAEWVNAATGGGGGQSIGAHFDGMGSIVLVNTIVYFRAKSAMTITGWSIVAEGTSPTCTLDIWKIASGTSLPTVSNTITASAKPALSTGSAVKSTTLTGWTTAVSADDIFAIKVDACNAATKISLTLYP
jgi:hypothetical protein